MEIKLFISHVHTERYYILLGAISDELLVTTRIEKVRCSAFALGHTTWLACRRRDVKTASVFSLFYFSGNGPGGLTIFAAGRLYEIR
jgi:hypothetical protein